MICCRCKKDETQTRFYENTSSTMCRKCQCEEQKKRDRAIKADPHWQRMRKIPIEVIAHNYNVSHPFDWDLILKKLCDDGGLDIMKVVKNLKHHKPKIIYGSSCPVRFMEAGEHVRAIKNPAF